MFPLKVPFHKYSGCGNNFLLFDHRLPFFPVKNVDLISKLCNQFETDGIILVENSLKADFKMRIFNRDGSEAEMCGNGIRCLLKFIRSLDFPEKEYSIETMFRLHKTYFQGENISIEMGQPIDIRWNLSLSATKNEWVVHYLDTGVPHVIIFITTLETLQLDILAPPLRHHSFFQPKGTNVNFVKVEKEGIRIRTFERGVEKETQACGTGATASAIAANKIYGLMPPISVHLQSGETLQISFYKEEDLFKGVTMSGPARLISSGTLIFD